MKITRNLDLCSWNQNTASVAIGYWKQRGFANAAIDPNMEVVGTRGSWVGNWTSFDMSKVKASVRMRPLGPSRVAVELDLNTIGQQITEWNRAYWRLEIIGLHKLLEGAGDLSEVWPRFSDASCRAAILWTLTASVLGQSLTADWAIEIAQLEGAALL